MMLYMMLYIPFNNFLTMTGSFLALIHEIRPNKQISEFRVTRIYLNLLVKPRFVFQISGKMYNFMHFEFFFFFWKKMCVPTLSKILRPVTRNTLIFLFGLSSDLPKDTALQ